MPRHSLVSAVLLAIALASCQKTETREVVTTTTQTSMTTTDTVPGVDLAPTATVPTATVTSSVVSTTTSERVTPAAKPVIAATKPAATASIPAPVTPKPAPVKVSTPTPREPPAAVEPTAKPVETVQAKVPEPPASTPPTKAATTAKNTPKSHTVDHGGVKHAAGSDNPMQKCAACHGKDLRGGKMAKTSCYECHEKTWK